ncbi:MAG: transposase [Bacteroidetes bacterium]|nr:transposase [Bacteroidota bacterium]
MENRTTRYSEDFKNKAVELAIERGNLVAVSRELKVSKVSLRSWKTKYEQQLNPVGRTLLKEQEEIKRLRKALRDAEEERDILKKAVSIFSTKDR